MRDGSFSSQYTYYLVIAHDRYISIGAANEPAPYMGRIFLLFFSYDFKGHELNHFRKAIKVLFSEFFRSLWPYISLRFATYYFIFGPNLASFFRYFSCVSMALCAQIYFSLGLIFNGQIYHISIDAAHLPAPYMGRFFFFFRRIS